MRWNRSGGCPTVSEPEKVAKGELFDVAVNLGREIAHPDQTEHHICRIGKAEVRNPLSPEPVL